MLRFLLLALLAVLLGCASVVITPDDGDVAVDDGSASDASVDRDASIDAPLDRATPDVPPTDVVEVVDHTDQITDAMVTDPECNDLFPFLPVTPTVHDAPPPALDSFRGGMIPDGTYRLIRRDVYRGEATTLRFLGRTLVVRGRSIQTVFLGTDNPDFSTAQARRATCVSEVPLGTGRPFCTYTCPDKLRGVTVFAFAHEMRGTQLVLSGSTSVTTYERVGP